MEVKMTKEEKYKRNVELCRRVKKNDLMAETVLLMENEGLVAGLARRMRRWKKVNSSDGFDEEDLLQEGRIALLTAAKKYNEKKGAQFSTYAYKAAFKAMNRLCRKLQSTFERQMEEDGLTRVFLSDGNAEEKMYVGRGCEVQWKDPTGNLAVLHLMLEKMQNRLKLLPERQRRLLAYHYGFGMLKANSISKTAAYFHLAERTLRKIEKEALGTLREMMNDGKIV
jgi:RNA polymerase sigma factor (sigma-70 family)